MRHTSKRGEILIRHVSATTDKSQKYASDEITHRPILYTDTMCIRVYSKKQNCIEYMDRRTFQMKEDKHLEYLYKRGEIKNIIHELPSNFVQINQSVIINLHFFSGRAENFLEVGYAITFPIGKKYREEVETKINEWFSYH